MKRQSFIVINQNGLHTRAFGPYRSLKAASGDADAWEAFVVPLEKPDAERPWDATGGSQ